MATNKIIPFSIIFAQSNNGAFGKDHKLPWSIKSELNYFRKITLGIDFNKEQKTDKIKSILIMGKTTRLGLPKSGLPSRLLYVLSTQGIDNSQSTTDRYFTSFVDALSDASTKRVPIFVIGGKKLIEEASQNPGLERIYKTVIEENYDFDVEAPKLKISDRCSDLILKTKDICKVKNKEVNISYCYWRQSNYTTDEEYYLNMLQNVLTWGNKREDRTKIGTLSFFTQNIVFDLTRGFPLLTTKYISFKAVVVELLWFLRGDTDTDFLEKHGITYWRENTSREFLDKRGLKHYRVGQTGPMYSFQWRHFGGNPDGKTKEEKKGFDQVANVIQLLKTDPTSRRIKITADNPSQSHLMALEPCHVYFQLYVEKDILNGIVYLRSNDLFLGAPYNIAEYALFIHILAYLSNLKVGYLRYVVGDAHIYLNHIEQVKYQLERPSRPLPIVEIVPNQNGLPKTIDDFELDHFKLIDYNPHPFIYGKMAI